MDIVSS